MPKNTSSAKNFAPLPSVPTAASTMPTASGPSTFSMKGPHYCEACTFDTNKKGKKCADVVISCVVIAMFVLIVILLMGNLKVYVSVYI